MRDAWQAALAALTLLFAWLAGCSESGNERMRFVTGPQGGSWYPLGAKIMQVMDEEIDGITTSNTNPEAGPLIHAETIVLDNLPALKRLAIDCRSRPDNAVSADRLLPEVHACRRSFANALRAIRRRCIGP